MKNNFLRLLKNLIYILGSITTFVTIYNWFNSNSELELNYRTIRLNDFIEPNQHSSFIKYFVNGKKYDSIFVSFFKFENIGISDIRKDDFDGSPIKFILNDSVNILKIHNFKYSPNFKPIITYSGDTILLDPILIKKNFYAEFEIITEGPISLIKSSSLIAGLDEISFSGGFIKKNKENKIINFIDKFMLLFAFALSNFIVLTLMLGKQENNSEISPSNYQYYRPTKLPYFIIIFGSNLLIIFGLIKSILCIQFSQIFDLILMMLSMLAGMFIIFIVSHKSGVLLKKFEDFDN